MKSAPARTRTTAPLLEGSILQDEIDLERRAVTEGIERYRRLAKQAVDRGEGSRLKPAERLVLHWTDRLVAGIQEDQRKFNVGEPEVGITIWGPLMRELDAETGAVLSLHEIMSTLMLVTSGVTIQKISHSLGKSWIAEANARLLRATKTEYTSQKTGKVFVVSQLDVLTHRLRKIDAGRVNWWARKHLDDPIDGRSATIHLGARILTHILSAATLANHDQEFVPAFEHKLVRRGKRQQGTIFLSREAKTLIERGHATRELLRPKYLPMVVPPYPWSRDAEGGYVEIRTPFIIKPTIEQKEAMGQCDLDTVYSHLTSLSATGLSINASVLDVVRETWKAKGGFAGIPSQHAIPPVPKPDGFAPDRPRGERWKDVDPDARSKWRADAIDAYKRSLQRKADRVEFLQRMSVAEEFKHREAMYFPKTLDFRGRAYSIPQALNFEGPDLCRGLLQLAREKYPGKRGMYWLKIHAANMFGVDKSSFADRERWADEHESEIVRSAEHPMKSEFWRQAKKPWQFLAACFAYIDKANAAKLIRQADGTCNALQHYAALGRDEEGAVAANLVWSEQPADIYGEVASRAYAIAARAMREGHPAAKLVIQHIDRDLCKPNTMTTFYGVTGWGRNEQMYAMLRERGFFGQQLTDAVKFLETVIPQAIGSVCPGATRIMAWLQVCARLFCADGKAFQFVSPLGLPVIQRYRNHAIGTVTTVLQQISVIQISKDSPLRVKKQAGAAAPNFIHSLDQTAMFMTAHACRQDDIDMVPVHDNYGTHLADADALDHHTRDQFVKLHSPDQLAIFHEQFSRTCPAMHFPDPPARGNFDIRKVMDSPYFFN